MIKQFVSSELQNVMVNMGLSCLFLVFLGGGGGVNVHICILLKCMGWQYEIQRVMSEKQNKTYKAFKYIEPNNFEQLRKCLIFK